MSLVSMLALVQNLLVQCEEFWLYLAVVDGWVVVSTVVSQVSFARLPEEMKLVLVDTAISKPVGMHCNGFCAFGLNTIVHDALCCGIVCLDGSGGLLVAFQYVSFLDSLPCINI